jgi:hypothetical protein
MTSSLHLLPFVAAAAAVLAFAAAPAMADQQIDYAVTIEGSLDYNRADVDAGASLQHDEAVDFRTHLPRLSFFGNAAQATAPALGTASITRSAFTMTGESATISCPEHTLTDVTGGGLEAQHHQDRTVFSVRAIDSFTIRVGGCPANLGPWDYAFTSGGVPVGAGIFDGAIALLHSRIGEASMSFPLSGAVTGTECPNAHFNTALCSLTWDATATFTRTGESELDDEFEPVPIGPGPTPPPPAVQDDDLLVPLVADAELARSLASASLPFTCASACTGTLTAKARGTRLARETFDADSGESRVKLRFDRGDRRAIRRAGKVKLTLAAIVGGEATKDSVVLRVPR